MGWPLCQVDAWTRVRAYENAFFLFLSDCIFTSSVLAVCLLAITALEKLTDFVGENFALYLGQSLGDLVVVSLDKFVLFLFPALPCMLSC